MSLSEVIGATFSNLQQAQQSFSVAPPGMSSSQPHNNNNNNIPTPSFTKILPEPNDPPIQTTAAPLTKECVPKSGSGEFCFNLVSSREFADRPNMQSSAKISAGANQNATRAGVSYQVKIRCSVFVQV